MIDNFVIFTWIQDHDFNISLFNTIKNVVNKNYNDKYHEAAWWMSHIYILDHYHEKLGDHAINDCLSLISEQLHTQRFKYDGELENMLTFTYLVKRLK